MAKLIQQLYIAQVKKVKMGKIFEEAKSQKPVARMARKVCSSWFIVESTAWSVRRIAYRKEENSVQRGAGRNWGANKTQDTRHKRKMKQVLRIASCVLRMENSKLEVRNPE